MFAGLNKKFNFNPKSALLSLPRQSPSKEIRPRKQTGHTSLVRPTCQAWGYPDDGKLNRSKSSRRTTSHGLVSEESDDLLKKATKAPETRVGAGAGGGKAPHNTLGGEKQHLLRGLSSRSSEGGSVLSATVTTEICFPWKWSGTEAFMWPNFIQVTLEKNKWSYQIIHWKNMVFYGELVN